jgi:uncharacterized protein (DUF1697 family)
MTSVAFFRNLNQGQRGHVTTAQLVDAFVVSGAIGVRPVRANGTVIFTADNTEECLSTALAQLHGASAWADVAFARGAAWLAERVSEFPANVAPPLTELSLFEGRLAHPLPMGGKGCSVVRAGDGYAVTVNDSPGTSQATPTLERALGTPVTSRSATTLRLVLDAM